MLNPMNEKLKYDYRVFLAKVKGRDPKTWVVAMQSLHRFEEFNKFADFIKINSYIASTYVDEMVSNHSLSFCEQNLHNLRDFYGWLERKREYRTKIDFNIIDYFRLDKNKRITARAHSYQESYKLEEIRQVISQLPRQSDIEQRNLAMISLQALCGLRTAELRSIKLKNLIFDESANRWLIYTNPRDMSVKYSKVRRAYFMPFDTEWKNNVLNWRDKLLSLGFSDKDPLFPVIESRFVQTNLHKSYLTKGCIQNSKTIRNIFHKAFTDVGVRYLHPHTFRHMIVRWAAQQSSQVLSAASQSLGHSSIHTTLEYYGQLATSQIGHVLNELE